MGVDSTVHEGGLPLDSEGVGVNFHGESSIQIGIGILKDKVTVRIRLHLFRGGGASPPTCQAPPPPRICILNHCFGVLSQIKWKSTTNKFFSLKP